MRKAEPITFERQRGIVWVCDVKNSTSAFNDEKTVDAVEEYLPRLMWIGEQIVEASGGEFIKWTGDGFLAWYNCELERNKGLEAATVLDAAWHLSFTNNITNLGVNSESKFQIRHGIAWEPDALIMNIRHTDNSKTKDILGRNIVFAFRISGIVVDFPHIVTQSSLISTSRSKCSINHHFEKLDFSDEDFLRYFKGEKRGVRYLMGSSILRKRNASSERPIRNQIFRTIDRGNKNNIKTARYLKTIENYMQRLNNGPNWSRKIIHEEQNFIKKDMLEALIDTDDIMNKIKSISGKSNGDDKFISYLTNLRSVIEKYKE